MNAQILNVIVKREEKRVDNLLIAGNYAAVTAVCRSRIQTKGMGGKKSEPGRRQQQQQPSWMCVGAAANAASPANNTVSCLARGVAAPASKRHDCYYVKASASRARIKHCDCVKEMRPTPMTTSNIFFLNTTPDEPFFFLFGKTRRMNEMAPLWARLWCLF